MKIGVIKTKRQLTELSRVMGKGGERRGKGRREIPRNLRVRAREKRGGNGGKKNKGGRHKDI